MQTLNLYIFKSSINLDSSIDLTDEGIGSKKANSTHKKPERENHDACISEVQQCGNELGDLKFGDKVENGVCKYVDCRTSRHNEAAPPPVVVLKYVPTLMHCPLITSTFSLTHSLTHSPTPWCRILFEKLIVTQLVKKYPAFFMEHEGSLPCSQKTATIFINVK
jgi:hypothetical protein